MLCSPARDPGGQKTRWFCWRNSMFLLKKFNTFLACHFSTHYFHHFHPSCTSYVVKFICTSCLVIQVWNKILIPCSNNLVLTGVGKASPAPSRAVKQSLSYLSVVKSTSSWSAWTQSLTKSHRILFPFSTFSGIYQTGIDPQQGSNLFRFAVVNDHSLFSPFTLWQPVNKAKHQKVCVNPGLSTDIYKPQCNLQNWLPSLLREAQHPGT